MENKRNTGLEKVSSITTFYSQSEDLHNDLTDLGFESNKSNPTIEAHSTNSHVIFLNSKGSTILEVTRETYKRNKHIYLEQVKLLCHQKNKLSFGRQSIDKYSNLYNKLLTKKPTVLNEAKLKNALNKEIRSLEKSIENLQELPSSLLSFKNFLGYHACSIFVHQKGEPTAKEFSSFLDGKSKQTPLSVKNFQKLYNTIKKSKTSAFNVNNLDFIPSFAVGNIIGTTLSTQFHNIIIALARNQFLPPDENEVIKLESFLNLSKSLLRLLIQKDQLDNSTKVLIQILNAFPKPLVIRKGSEIILENKQFLADHGQFDKSLHTELELPNDYRLKIFYTREDYLNYSDYIHTIKINLLGELLNTLKHEISNPLFGLKLVSSILVDEVVEEDSKLFLKEIVNNINRCENILENFAEIYTQTDKTERFSIKKAINESLVLAKSEMKTIRKEISYLEIDEADPLMIKSNLTSIVQILFNLIVNAAQAMSNTQAQQVKILCKQQHNHIIVEIHDNGPGLSEKIKKDLFSPFNTTKDTGTGLGLSICKNLASHINGDIFYRESDILNGCCFSLTIPVHEHENTYS